LVNWQIAVAASIEEERDRPHRVSLLASRIIMGRTTPEHQLYVHRFLSYDG